MKLKEKINRSAVRLKLAYSIHIFRSATKETSLKGCKGGQYNVEDAVRKQRARS